MRTYFGPANPMGAAKLELQHPTMAHSSQLAEYLVHFNTLASRVAWGEAALHFQFYDSLPDGLKDGLGLLGKPDSLWELVRTMQHFDNLYWERQEEQKLARSRDNRLTGGPTLKTLTSGGGQQPNCTNDKTHSPDGKLKPEERKHHHKNNLCAICSRGDHKVVVCTMYAKGRASHLRTEETQTPPEAAEPPQPLEVTKMTRKTRETDRQPLAANTTEGLPPHQHCPSTPSQHHIAVPEFILPLTNLPLHKEPP